MCMLCSKFGCMRGLDQGAPPPPPLAQRPAMLHCLTSGGSLENILAQKSSGWLLDTPSDTVVVSQNALPDQGLAVAHGGGGGYIFHP